MALAARATQKSPTLGITNGNRGNATPEGSIDSNINSSFYRNNEGRTWADHLRSFQIDVPDAGLEALSSERERIAASQKLGVGGRADGASTGGGDDSSLGSGMQGVSGGLGSDTNGTGSSGGDSGPVWDGQGVEASTVIQHRRRFDVRCTAYEVRSYVLLLLMVMVEGSVLVFGFGLSFVINYTRYDYVVCYS